MRVDCEWCGYGMLCGCTPGHRSTFEDEDAQEHEDEENEIPRDDSR